MSIFTASEVDFGGFDNSLALFPYSVCFPAVGGLVGTDDCVSTDIFPNKNRTEEH